MKKAIFLIALFCTSFFIKVENQTINSVSWEQSVLDSMTTEEKIGQLFMVAAYSNKDDKHVSEIENLITKYHVGGLIFFQGNSKKQLELTNYFQDLASTPLMIGIDGEWGLNMRLKDTRKYPFQMTLGSLSDNGLIYEMGKEIGKECNAMGIHVNFAPVADINNNPNNPIINFRSFGENREKVATYALAYARGMQDQKVIACAKHFPGHGDTDTDSHKGLPSLPYSKERLDSLELYPFKHMFKNGVISTMVAHINIPAYDDRANRAASISKEVVTKLLKEQMHFNGLVFTDALNMKGVAKYFSPGELDLIAFEAGNDVLLFPEDVPTAVLKFKEALKSGRIKMPDLDARVKKILHWKKWAGLDQYRAKPIGQLDSLLHLKQADELVQKIANQAICLVKNEDFIPLKTKEETLAVVNIGGEANSPFVQELKKVQKLESFQLSKKAGSSEVESLKSKLHGYKKIIVTFQDPSIWSTKSFGYSGYALSLAQWAISNKRTLLVPFTNPYLLKNFQKADNVLVGYEDGVEFQTAAARVVLGKLGAKGTLPVTIGIYQEGGGIKTSSLETYLPYSTPMQEGVSNDLKNLIRPYLVELVEQRAAPGGQVLVARNGKVIYEEAFGYHTYEKKQKVQKTDLYDIASITKVAATTLSIMKLQEEGLMSIKDPIGKYLPVLKGTNKANLIIEDIMLHQSRLKAWIPFYLGTLDWRDSLYSSFECGSNCVLVAKDLYGDSLFKETIINQIIASPLSYSKQYKYSDLGFILLKYAIENVTNTPFDEFVQNTFYEPMGLSHTLYKPLEKFKPKQIAPTENDTLFRRQLLQGYVHDPAAGMLGGVAGHAGLFSNATELAVLFQMLLNGGEYNGTRYLKKETVDYFTERHGYKSRRGIGFDKRENNPRNIMNLTDEVSLQAFGHTGFTGTCVWVDPKYNLVYVFLSNRIHPNQENKTLLRGNYRTEIQKKIYQAIID